MTKHKTIAETNKFIVLNEYTNIDQSGASYQTEADLERELIKDLQAQGYEYVKGLTSTDAMLKNARVQLEELNNVKFKDSEWLRFCEQFLDSPSDNVIDKTRKIQDDYIYDFVFDDGSIQNIYLVNKDNVSKNKLQVISQFEQAGSSANRYDVTVLVNGLPLVHIELKKRGVAIREAFNQIHRYSKESFNIENSLYKYLQVFVISNGTDTRYFANTLKREKNSYDFTMNWARKDNKPIKDLKDFTATFFAKQALLNIVLKYSVFDINNTLLVMRPYQIAATERIIEKVRSAYEAKDWSKTNSGGYIWHTTGSGKTLTSFKAARLATELDFIDKVFFVVDRKDLDYQTMKEYKRFSPDSVNGSKNTAGLKKNINKKDNKIIVTTIQKLNNLIKSENSLDVYDKQVVFIFDEAHRSQFGEAQKNIRKKFKKYYQFGFTGTPIFPENALGYETTASVFGEEIHAYVITDAIRDEKVLKFKVDYNDVRPKFSTIEKEQDTKKLSAAENKKALLHPERIKEVSKYILENYKRKTHRLAGNGRGFNAMFAVSSVDAAKCYYEAINNLQKDSDKKLKIATIFSFAANEAQSAIGEIVEESFEPSAMDSSAKEFLSYTIDEYNKNFGMNYNISSKEFENYYKDLAKRVKNKEVDLLIVVGMFLTGFDAPKLNTLFVDKNLRYHGLIQAFSRTNRIYDATKTFGNIVTFRDLEDATNIAIKRFGAGGTKNIILEKSYKEYMEGFTDIINGQQRRGYIEVVNNLREDFANSQDIETEEDKRKFAKLFGEYLRVENILQNYDEFNYLKTLQSVDISNEEDVEKFINENHITNEEFFEMKEIDVLEDRLIQDYRSSYNDIREWIRKQREGKASEDLSEDWDEVVFEVDLLKSQEINLDYILELIYEKNKQTKDKNELIEDIKRLIRSSIDNRAKEAIIIEFINSIDLDEIKDKVNIIESFYKFAQEKQVIEATRLIEEESLNKESAKRYINNALKKEYASENGTELNSLLPKMSPLNPKYLTKKQEVFEKISAFIEKYKGIGGKV